MVGIAQLARAPDCGSGGRRFKPDYPPHLLFRSLHILGCRQAVRQRTLTPSSAGSNPAIPARKEPTFVYDKCGFFLTKFVLTDGINPTIVG